MNATLKSAPQSQRRLLVINPNSNPEVTARIQLSADRVLGADCTALVIHPAKSPRSIETFEDRLQAEPHAIELLSQRQDFDAYVMACFDDIGIKAARQFLKAPIVDSVEASIAVARLYATRFAIVTTVETMVPGIKDLIATYSAAEQCSVRAAGIGVAAAAAGDPEALRRLDDTIKLARNVDGAGAIILGSGGLTGHGACFSRRHGMPVIDCIEAAVLMADMASRCFLESNSAQKASCGPSK